MKMLIIRPFFFVSFSLLISCGGDDLETASVEDSVSQNDEISEGVENIPEIEEEFEDKIPAAAPEVVKVPDPNGVYLPTGEMKNGQPVYANSDGFNMWFNGSTWRITDRTGGGNLIAAGKENINDSWVDGAKVRHYPDEKFSKDALFRLAVAYQGSMDNANALRLFKQFISDYPDDPKAAEVFLSLGDIVMSQVKPDEYPTYAQISEARESYSQVRKISTDIEVVSDATFNEGGVLEAVVDKPDGLIDHYYTFDKNNDELLQASEFQELNPLGGSAFSDHDLNDDKALDFGELAELAIHSSYSQIETLFKEYNDQYALEDGARISQATEKIGFACEKQGRPSEMLEMYFSEIKKFGNDPNRVGVDEILKKYTSKYQEYDKLYGLTLELLEKLQNPSETVSFSYRNRKGIEEVISGTVEEIVKDRRKLLPFLSTNFTGIDPGLYKEVAKLRGAIFSTPQYVSKFKGYFNKYKKLVEDFPADLAPSKSFAVLLNESINSGQKTLELRMRASLAKVDSKAGGNYNPQRSDFPAASPGVLVWMGQTMLAQNSIDDAIAAMERLIQVFGDSGGDFLFDAHYLLGMAKEKSRDFYAAASHYESALQNSSWHNLANDARMRKGTALFKVGEETKDPEVFGQASDSFQEVRSDTDTNLDIRAECSFMMGECKRALKDYAGAAFLYLETTLNFPGAIKWAPKSYEKAISCFEQSGETDQITKIEKQYQDWQRKFLK